MNHFKINHSNKVYTHKAVCRLLPIFRQHTHPSQTVCVDTHTYNDKQSVHTRPQKHQRKWSGKWQTCWSLVWHKLGGIPKVCLIYWNSWPPVRRYVKTNGEVMMQRGLSKERPCFRSLGVETECGVKQVTARHGVVWAVTDTMKLLVRTGISNDIPQGLHWQEIDR